jgi:alkanesulfonate monooxygenase SsuD/methylene tetrahydromethanopterin reductase-like flavin-dependent oxidoreductase (luciferase family)
MEVTMLAEYGQAKEPFGAWLMAQKDRGDWIDPIAAAARADRGFPRNGTPDQVRDRLRDMGADGDAFAALDDAELDWMSY